MIKHKASKKPETDSVDKLDTIISQLDSILNLLERIEQKGDLI